MDDRRGIQFLDHYRTGHHITPTQMVTIHNRAGGEPRRLTEPHWMVALHSLLQVSSSMRESLKLGFWADADGGEPHVDQLHGILTGGIAVGARVGLMKLLLDALYIRALPGDKSRTAG
jgi:hypothetical protein